MIVFFGIFFSLLTMLIIVSLIVNTKKSSQNNGVTGTTTITLGTTSLEYRKYIGNVRDTGITFNALLVQTFIANNTNTDESIIPSEFLIKADGTTYTPLYTEGKKTIKQSTTEEIDLLYILPPDTQLPLNITLQNLPNTSPSVLVVNHANT